MITHLPQVLTADELARARQLLARAPWADGRATAGPQAATVKHNQQLPSHSDQAQALRALVLGALDRHALFFSAALPRRVLPPAFNRYAGAANHYGNHVDQAVRHIATGPLAGQRLRADLSCTLFFSDPASYDGGGLVIDGGWQPPPIKLAAGDAILYPGTSVHRVAPVTRGERLASFFWVESLVRHTEQRRILFDMDTALQQLRQRDGESAEAVALTGTYHNLLRLWAET
ncbi:MAG: Fe2+-dependent dioxygenase [Aquabacterium sp.]|nr:Fe2+-dependent dioxygenase [Aquabacterium sp.]